MSQIQRFVAVICTLIATSFVSAEEKIADTDLMKILDGKGWVVDGRKASKIADESKKGVHLDLQEGEGIAWLKGIEFSDGTIEVDLRGEDVYKHSFVGVAFRVQNATTFDAVYFRPFNFKVDDADRKSHGVQYISLPDSTWRKLRDEHPGKFENAINPVPDPNGWFHARIVLKGRKVSVYVNDAKEPCLVVNEISDRKGGAVGIYVADQSGGDFANLKVTPAR